MQQWIRCDLTEDQAAAALLAPGTGIKTTTELAVWACMVLAGFQPADRPVTDRELALRAKVSVRTVQRARQALRRRGLLWWASTPGRPNRYAINAAAVAEMSGGPMHMMSGGPMYMMSGGHQPQVN